MELVKVRANSHIPAVAGAIAKTFREHHRAEVQAIGPAAVNHAVKALIMATLYLEEEGIFVGFVPEFVQLILEDKERTAIKFVVEPREPIP
jgi:stage V sporulation protein S